MKQFTQASFFTMVLMALCFMSFTKKQKSADKQKKETNLFVDESWNKVSLQAKEIEKPIFVYITDSYCKSLKRMDKVFKDKELSSNLKDNFICKKLDVQNVFNNMKANNWGIKSIPAYVFMNKSGDIIYQCNGIKSIEQMQIEANNALLTMKHTKTK